MLLRVLRLTPKKWFEILNDNNHKTPDTPDQFEAIKRAIFRERVFEQQVANLQQHGRRCTEAAQATGVYGGARGYCDGIGVGVLAVESIGRSAHGGQTRTVGSYGGNCAIKAC